MDNAHRIINEIFGNDDDDFSDMDSLIAWTIQERQRRDAVLEQNLRTLKAMVDRGEVTMEQARRFLAGE